VRQNRQADGLDIARSLQQNLPESGDAAGNAESVWKSVAECPIVQICPKRVFHSRE
jgi:hypothetical protein